MSQENKTIPKLALNFLISKDTDLNFDSLFDRMRGNKIIYIEVVLQGVESVEDVRKISAIFKKMRTTKHIDYTIWLDLGDPFKMIPIFEEANKFDRYVMGVTSSTEYMGISNFMEHMINFTHPNIYDLLLMDDERALKDSHEALEHAHCPEGMKRGLKRVLDDCIKLYYRAPQEPHLEETPISSDQELE